MHRLRQALLIFLLLVVVVAAVAAVRVASFAPAAADTPRAGELGYPWRGAVHVHSRASDGAGDLDEIMAAAAAADLDFVVLTDHNPSARDRPAAAWHGDVLLIPAEEISTDSGHLLALQVRPHRYRFGPTARQALADVHDEGGWALIAHPEHSWQDWHGGHAGTEGLEILNLAGAWSRQGVAGRLATVGAALVDGGAAGARLMRLPWPALPAWDERTALRRDASLFPLPRVGIGASDAHGPFVAATPGYAFTFGLLATLVWADASPRQEREIDDAEGTTRRLLERLRTGRAAIEVTALGDARNFSFVAASASEVRPMGAIAEVEAGPWTLRAQTRPGTEMRLMRDGAPVTTVAERVLETTVSEPGTYRVEVYRPEVATADGGGPPWLMSNPIYVWPATARAAARLRRVPPLPAPPVIRDLLAGAVFEANERGVAGNRVRGTAPVRWRFELQDPSHREAFAAMAWRPSAPLDWSDADGVVVDLRARQTLRVNLEIRADDAGGTEQSWVHSIKAGPASVPVAVPWSRFHAPWSEEAGDLRDAASRRPRAGDLSRVHGVFLVVTPLLLEAGSEARVQLFGLGLYGTR